MLLEDLRAGWHFRQDEEATPNQYDVSEPLGPTF
jgi:hypothetical protein